MEDKKVDGNTVDLAALVESAADILCMVARKGEVLYVNSAVEATLGYAAEELVGQNLLELLHPEDVAETRTALEEPGTAVEARCRHRDGRWVYLEIAGGRRPTAHGTALSIRDVTEQRVARDALQASEEKFRALFEDSLDAICIGTVEGQLLDVNPAFLKLFGYSSKEEMLEMNIGRDLYWNPEDRKKNEQSFRDQDFVEVDLKTRDGKRVRVQETASPIYDRYGGVLGFRGILRDVTAQRRLEEQLRRSQKVEPASEPSPEDLEGGEETLDDAG